MHIFRSALSLAVYFSAVLAVNPLLTSEGSIQLSQRSNGEQTSDHISNIESRQAAEAAETVKRVLKVWIKIGKSAVKAFTEEVIKQNQAGAGFFRDFSDLIDQLPDPPAGINQDAPPTKRSPIKKRSANQLTMCKDFHTADTKNCKRIDIDNGALTSGFNIDNKALSKILGGGVSSIRIETPGLICGFASKVQTKIKGSFFNAVGIQHCAGTRVLVQNDFVDLPAGLNDNVQCIGCFKSPGA